MKSVIASFISGIVFAVGLGIGGMTQPAKVIGFLDFAGNWDPSLAFVMIGAIGIHFFFYLMLRKRTAPVFLPTFSVPTRREIDARLVVGASVFGLGWGIGGYCPGPALTSLGSGNLSPAVFSVAMIAGMFLYKFLDILRFRQELLSKPCGESDKVSSIDS